MKHLSFFTNSIRDLNGSRTVVDTMVTTRSLFRKTLLFLAFILLPMTGWGALKTIKTIDFGTWSNQTICNTKNNTGETINGVLFYSKNSTAKPFSISGGVMTWCNNNASGSNYYLAFPVTGVSDSVIIKVYNGTTSTRFKYNVVAGTTPSAGSNGPSTSSFGGIPSEVKVDVDNSKSDFVIYVGRNGSSLTQVTKIEVLTVNSGPADPTIELRDTTYEIGSGNLDLTKLFKSDSKGTVTYSLYAAGTTATASVSGTNFTASAVGTAQVIAAQAEESGKFNAKNDTNTITVTAATQKYAVTFAAGEGTGEMTALQKAENDVVTLPVCTFTAPAGKAFDKWAVVGVTGVTELADGGSFTMPANAVNLTATYKKVPVVIYDFNNSIGSQSVKAGGATITGTTEMSFSGGSDQITITPKTKSKIEDGATINVSGTSNSDSKYFGVKVYKADGITLLANVVASALVKKGTVTNAQVVLSLDDDLDDIVIARYESTTTKVKSFTITNPAAKDTASVVVELSDLKVAGTSVSDEDLATLKSQKTLTLTGSFVSAPEITFVEKTTITFTDETQKVKYNNIVKQAESVSEGFYTVTATINNVTYTVKAPAVQSVKAAFYDGAKKLGVLDVEYNTAPVAAQYAAFEVKPLSTFDKWYSDAEFQTPANMSAAITDSTAYFGKWTTAYAQSIDMEQFVIENTKKGDYATFIANKNWQLSNAKELDSLNSAKPANNYPYLGLKFNSASGEVLGNITAGKLVTIKTGNMPSDNAARIVYANAKDTTYLKKNTDSEPTISYMYSEAAEVLKFQTLTGSTTMLKAILVTDPFVVTYNANGGDPVTAQTFKGDTLTAPSATNGTKKFKGWYTAATEGEKVLDADQKFIPSASVEYFAQWEDKSSDKRLSALVYTFNGVVTPITIDDAVTEYNVVLPYKATYTSMPVITVALKDAKASIDGDISQATSVPGAATFTVKAENETTQAYTVNFTKGPKDGVCLIKGQVTGSNTVTITVGEGTGAASGIKNTSTFGEQTGYKFNNRPAYIGVALSDERHFQKGDVVNVFVTTTYAGPINLWYGMEPTQKMAEASTNMVQGVNTIVLTEDPETDAIYLCRGAEGQANENWNPYVAYIEVLRPMNPTITGISFNGVAAVVNNDANPKTIAATVPYSTDFSAITVVDTIISNDNSKVTKNYPSTWVEGDNTITLTDKDGDATTYTVTLTKAAASDDATLKSLSVTGYTLDPAFAAETLEYTIERAYKDKDAELPAISYEVNYAAATAVKTTEGKVVTITVTAEDGTTQKAYTITFTNKAASTDATLKSLKYGDKAITLVADQYTYNVNLPYGTTEVPALTAVKNDELASDPVINNATAFVDLKATSTATVTAESGAEQVYTVNFTVAEFPSVVIFDGSTMSAMATSPDASGLSWAEVGTTMSQADKSATYQDVSYTKSLQLGNTSATKHFTITVPENKMAKIRLLIMTNSSGSTRSAWITTTADKGNKEDAIMSVSSSSYTDLGDGTTDWLADNTTYYIHTDNTVNFFVISVELKPIAPKCEVPAITAQPESNTQFGAGDMTASVTASVTDGGTLSYQWYNASDDSEVAGATAATLTTTTEGSYYVIITNTLADHRDNSVKSETAQLGYRTLDDATLSALGYGETAITLVDAQYTYEIELAKGTTEVPALTATTSSPYATKVITDATAFVDYKATSTVVVTAEDLTTQLTYTVNFTVRHDVELQDVTGDMTWDFTNSGAVDAQVNGQDGTYLVLANCDGVKSSFNGQYMSANFNKITTGNLQGKGIKIHTTTPGLITIEFSNTGKKDNNRVLYINGVATTAKSKNTTHVTYSQMMPAGDIELTAFEENASWNMLNYYKITFTEATRLDRSDLTAGKVTGVCLENNVTHFLGAKFYYLSHKATDESYIELASVDTLKEGYPYIMIAEGKDVYYMPGTVTATAAQNYNGLYGTFVDQPLGDGYCILLNNKYYRTHDGNNNGCYNHRAYLKLDEVSTTAQPAPGEEQVNPVARRIRLGSAEAQTATGFDMIGETELGEPRKFIINDQVVIIRNGQMYNAQGALLK